MQRMTRNAEGNGEPLPLRGAFHVKRITGTDRPGCAVRKRPEFRGLRQHRTGTEGSEYRARGMSWQSRCAVLKTRRRGRADRTCRRWPLRGVMPQRMRRLGSAEVSRPLHPSVGATSEIPWTRVVGPLEYRPIRVPIAQPPPALECPTGSHSVRPRRKLVISRGLWPLVPVVRSDSCSTFHVKRGEVSVRVTDSG